MANILPGSGWSGATSEPSAQGDSGELGYSRRVIARFDVVPYQTITEPLKVGVVAFHINASDIDRVEFAIDDGTWVPVSSMTLNSDTNVVEYWVTLDPADCDDGEHEIRAIVYPTHGLCRVLTLPIYTNADSTLDGDIVHVATTGNDTTGNGTLGNPYATISKAAYEIYLSHTDNDVGGGVVKLAAGSYQLGAASEGDRTCSRWFTIQAGDGVAQADAIISSQGSIEGLRTGKVRLHGVTITAQLTSAAIATGDMIWTSNCRFTGTGRYDLRGPNDDSVSWQAGWFATDCTVYNTRRGVSDVELARNVSADQIGESGLRNYHLAINITLSNFDREGDVTFHPDVLQHTQNKPNSIVYGLTAVDGINDTAGIRFQPGNDDQAMVNVTIAEGVGVTYIAEFERPYNNWLLKNVNLTGAVLYDSTNLTVDDVVFENVTFSEPTIPPGAYPGITYRSNSTTSAPVITPAGGSYEGTQVLEMYSDTVGATIRYTLDGTDPSEVNGEIYSFPIGIAEDTEVRAIAYMSGLSASEITTETYDINTPTLPPEVSVGQLNATIIRLTG